MEVKGSDAQGLSNARRGLKEARSKGASRWTKTGYEAQAPDSGGAMRHTTFSHKSAAGSPKFSIRPISNRRRRCSRRSKRSDFGACIAHLHFPLGHRWVIRTTDLRERLFGVTE